MTEKMMNRLVIFLTCLCVAFGIALALQYERNRDLQQQNTRMEQQIKELTGQVNEITAQWMELVKRVKYHG